MFNLFKNLFQPKLVNAAQAWQQAGIQIKRQTDNQPNNQPNNQSVSAYWLYAAPVHLALQRDSFSLAALLQLENDEIDALTGALNKHFAFDALDNKATFFWHETQWFLHLETNPNIQTHAPKLALNKDINTFLPTGKGAIKWASFTNEIQMLLFEHPVNQAREAKNLPTVNSIWCYGGGEANANEAATNKASTS